LEQVVVHKDTGEVRRLLLPQENTGTLSYALTSLGPEVADAKRPGRLLVARWEIENGSFWVRDVLLRAASPLGEHQEDACQVRGQVLADLRALVVSLLHREGIRQLLLRKESTGKKAALEAFSFHPLSALRFLGLYAV